MGMLPSPAKSKVTGAMADFSFWSKLVSFFLCILILESCHSRAVTQQLVLVEATSGIRLEVAEEDALPALRVALPGEPASDPGIFRGSRQPLEQS